MFGNVAILMLVFGNVARMIRTHERLGNTSQAEHMGHPGRSHLRLEIAFVEHELDLGAEPEVAEQQYAYHQLQQHVKPHVKPVSGGVLASMWWRKGHTH